MKFSPFVGTLCLCFLFGMGQSLAAQGPNQTSPSSTNIADNIAEARAFLKGHLKELNQRYPFQQWMRDLEKARADFERLKPRFNQRPIDLRDAVDFRRLNNQIEELRGHRANVQVLINEMYVQVVAYRVEERFKQAGKSFMPEAKMEFIRQLKPYEAGSLQPKTAYLGGLASLETAYGSARNDWLVAYAENFLAKRIESQLQGNDLQKNETLYDGYSLQLDYWRGQIQTNAAQAYTELQKMGGKWGSDRAMVQSILVKLTDVLNTDMLFSELLAAASQDGVDFPLEVEEHLEAELRQRQFELRAPIEQRKRAWNAFQASLKSTIELAKETSESQQLKSIAEAEEKHLEQERLLALQAEQERQEREQKEKFQQTLTALKTFTFKGENSVSLDDDAEKALTTETGFLKSSYVGSGQKTLKVKKAKFSDTLAYVDKFSMAEGSIDLSKMSLEEKTMQSAYVYTSPSGRTNAEDLNHFVNLVALGSFETGYNFFSYVPMGNIRVGAKLRWAQDKANSKAEQDRNFSYVDLVVDAHRVYHDRMKAGESRTVVRSVNVPANMIIFFDDKGGVKRFLSFSDTYDIVVRSSDLCAGRLYYKFLNYSTDRRNIYLNGIDPEIKIAQTNS